MPTFTALYISAMTNVIFSLILQFTHNPNSHIAGQQPQPFVPAWYYSLVILQFPALNYSARKLWHFIMQHFAGTLSEQVYTCGDSDDGKRTCYKRMDIIIEQRIAQCALEDCNFIYFTYQNLWLKKCVS